MQTSRFDNSFWGAIALTSAFTAWGFFPIYWKVLNHINPFEILINRIFWSSIFLLFLLYIKKEFSTIRVTLKQKKNILVLFGTTILISTNWFTYILAVSTDRLLESSFGYFLSPLVNVSFGIIFLKEKLSKLQWLSVTFALIGLITLYVEVGGLPWISLVLSLSFSFYVLLRKITPVDSLVGLAIETTLLLPLTFGYIFYLQIHNQNSLTQGTPIEIIFLIFSGVATATPMIWYIFGAKRLKLSTVGLLQYISPTLQFLLAVYLFKEPFNQNRFLAFVFIWIALMFFSFDSLKKNFKRSLIRKQ